MKVFIAAGCILQGMDGVRKRKSMEERGGNRLPADKIEMSLEKFILKNAPD